MHCAWILMLSLLLPMVGRLLLLTMLRCFPLLLLNWWAIALFGASWELLLLLLLLLLLQQSRRDHRL
jgi:hypothetical protein